MTDHIWVGGAPAVAQVDTITIPSDVEEGQVFTATINQKALTYTLPAGPTQTSVAAAIVAAWNASDIAEFNEITAANAGNGVITLTSDTEGVPFIVTVKIGDGDNEKQTITLGNSPTAGTFTLTYDGQTTGNIAYDASAATVDAALEALSNIGSGDVTVTGSDGGPWTVEFTGALAETDVDLMTADASNLVGTNEQQIISLGTVTGGTFTLTYSGQTTGNIAYNADAATVEAALEGLSNIGAGEATTTGSAGGPWTVAFSGALGGTDVDPITVDGTNLTGKLSVSITETTDGVSGGENEKHIAYAVGSSGVDGEFTITGDNSVSSGTFTIGLSVGGSTVMTTASIAYDATLTDIQDAIDTAASSSIYYEPGEIVIFGEAAGTTLVDGATLTIKIRCSINKEGTVSPSITNSLTGGTYSASAVTNVTNSLTSSQTGSFYLTYDGDSTDDIAINASASSVQAELEGLSSIGSGNVTVTQTGGTGLADSGAYIIEFTGTLANTNIGLTPTIGTNSGTDYTLSAGKMYTGLAGTNEEQQISISGSPVAGTFVLEYDGVQTGLLDYDSTAAEIDTALEALSSIGTGNVVCTGGPLPGTPVDVEFIGDLSAQSLDLITAPGGSSSESVAAGGQPTVTIATPQTPVTHTTTTASEGPNHWDVAANWDTNTVPSNSDNVYIIDGEDILYGLDQSSLTLGTLQIHNYETVVGLPRRNADYYEYRTRFLTLAGVTTVIVGLGDAGNGSERVNIDIGTSNANITVYNSGGGANGEPAVQIVGANSSNTAELMVLAGEVGVAVFPKDAAYFNKVTLRDGQLTIGTDVTIKELIATGGLFKSDRTTIDGAATL